MFCLFSHHCTERKQFHINATQRVWMKRANFPSAFHSTQQCSTWLTGYTNSNYIQKKIVLTESCVPRERQTVEQWLIFPSAAAFLILWYSSDKWWTRCFYNPWKRGGPRDKVTSTYTPHSHRLRPAFTTLIVLNTLIVFIGM